MLLDGRDQPFASILWSGSSADVTGLTAVVAPLEANKDAKTRVAIVARLERKRAQRDKALVGSKGYRRLLAIQA